MLMLSLLFFFLCKNMPKNNAGQPNFNFLNRKMLIINNAFFGRSRRAQNRKNQEALNKYGKFGALIIKTK